MAAVFARLEPTRLRHLGDFRGKGFSKPHKSVGSLKRDLVKAWSKIDEKMVRVAIDQFPRRLRACIRANGGIFDNELL